MIINSLKYVLYQGLGQNTFLVLFYLLLFFFIANRWTETNGVFFVAVVLLVFANPLISQSKGLLLLRWFFLKTLHTLFSIQQSAMNPFFVSILLRKYWRSMSRYCSHNTFIIILWYLDNIIMQSNTSHSS